MRSVFCPPLDDSDVRETVRRVVSAVLRGCPQSARSACIEDVTVMVWAYSDDRPAQLTSVARLAGWATSMWANAPGGLLRPPTLVPFDPELVAADPTEVSAPPLPELGPCPPGGLVARSRRLRQLCEVDDGELVELAARLHVAPERVLGFRDLVTRQRLATTN